MSQKTGAILRIIAIILMSAAALFTFLGGVGTTCIAFNAEQYGKVYAAFIPYKPTYQVFVYVSLLAGIAGLAATWATVRGYKWAYWGAIVTVAAGLAVAGVQMYYSSTLKEISFFAVAPTNMRFYVSIVTLVFLLLLRLPGVWQWADFALPWRGRKSSAGGLAAIVMGAIALSTPMWAAPGHIVDGYNLVYVLEIPLMVSGLALALGGLGLLVVSSLGVSRQEIALALRRRVAPVRAVNS